LLFPIVLRNVAVEGAVVVERLAVELNHFVAEG
jgi:hypothetical protein